MECPRLRASASPRFVFLFFFNHAWAWLRRRVFIFHLRVWRRAAALDVLRRYKLGEPETFPCDPFDKLPITISRNPPLPHESCLSCRKRISPTARVVEKVIQARAMPQLRAAEDETAECAEDAETAL